MKTLKINEKTHKKLMNVKISKGYKTLDETINNLIDNNAYWNFKEFLNNDK